MSDYPQFLAEAARTVIRSESESKANLRLLNTMSRLLAHAGYTVEVHTDCVVVFDPVHRSFGGQLIVDHFNKCRIVDLDQLCRFLDARS